MLTEEMIVELLDRLGLVGLIDLIATVCELQGVQCSGNDLPSAKVWFRNAKRLDDILRDLEA